MKSNQCENKTLICTALIILIAALTFLLTSCEAQGTKELSIGETYTYDGGMEVTVESVDTYQRENFGEIYTFSAFKIKYENHSDHKSVTITDFKIEDEKGKTNSMHETTPKSRWNIDVKELEPGEYSPGSVIEGTLVFKGDARNITLEDNLQDVAIWNIK